MTLQDYLRLKNGSDVRGVAIDGVEGEPVTLTEEAAENIAKAFCVWLIPYGENTRYRRRGLRFPYFLSRFVRRGRTRHYPLGPQRRRNRFIHDPVYVYAFKGRKFPLPRLDYDYGKPSPL